MPSHSARLSHRVGGRRRRNVMSRAANVDMEDLTELISNVHPEGLYLSLRFRVPLLIVRSQVQI